MSAYLVSSDHIAQIINWIHTGNRISNISRYNLFRKKEIFITPDGMASYLTWGNIQSITARYKDRMGYSDEDFKAYTQEVLDKVKVRKPSSLTAADVYNMCNCLEYQSCEIDNWIETNAYWTIHNIQAVAAREMASNANQTWEYKANAKPVVEYDNYGMLVQ